MSDSQTDSDSGRPARWLADCPACTRGLGVTEQFKDKTIRCPVCGETFSLASKRLEPIATEELPDSTERVVVVRAQKRRPGWYRRIRITATMWTVAAIVAVLAVGWLAYRRLRPPPPPPERAPKVVLKKLPVIGNDQTRHRAPIRVVARTPVGSKVLVGDQSGVIKLWNLQTGQLEKTFKADGPVTGLVYLSDALHFLVGLGESSGDTSASRMQRWSLVDGRPDQDFPVRKPVRRMVADAQRKRLLVAYAGQDTFDLFDIDAAQRVQTFEGHDRPVSALAFDSEGRLCASGSEDQTARLWNASTGATLATFAGHKGTVTSVAIVGDNGPIVTGESERILRAFDRTRAKELWMVPALEDPLYDLTVDEAGRWLVLRSGTLQYSFWFLPDGQKCPFALGAGGTNPVDRSGSPIAQLAYWPDLRRLLLATSSGVLELYQVQTELPE